MVQNGATPRGANLALGLCAAILLTSNCGQPAPEELPSLEPISTTVLDRETTRAIESVRTARGLLERSPAEAADLLQEAETALVHLTAYYHPLVEARSLTYNAYTHYGMGRRALAANELKSAEEVLRKVRQEGSAQTERVIAMILEHLLNAIAALEAGQSDAGELIGHVANQMNHAILKGPIELGGG